MTALHATAQDRKHAQDFDDDPPEQQATEQPDRKEPNPLDFCRPLDTSLTTTDPRLWSLADHLLSQTLPGMKRSRQAYRQNLVTLLANLYLIHRLHLDMHLAYSRGKEHYQARDHRYNPLGISYACMVGVVDALTAHGYLEGRKGFNDRARDIGRSARLSPTTKLLGAFRSHADGLDLAHLSRERELLVMKDKDKRPMAYRDTKDTRAMRRRLEGFNAFLAAQAVGLRLSPLERLDLVKKTTGKGELDDGHQRPPYDPTRTSFHRVFNNASFDQGGRFFGHWVQSLPSDLRRRVTINGEPVVEWDFRAMAVNQLYVRAGLELPVGDPYQVPGLLRPQAKLALQAAINAPDQLSAARAISQEAGVSHRQAADVILPALARVHAPIADWFHSGLGIYLQRQESEIAERVILDLMVQGIPCLPVHDSFLVQLRHSDHLQEAMGRHSREVLGRELPRDLKR